MFDQAARRLMGMSGEEFIRRWEAQACHELLEPEANGCVICGAPVGEGVAAPSANGDTEGARPANVLRYDESSKGRHLAVRFTDAAVGSLSAPLRIVLSDRMKPAELVRSRAGAHTETLTGLQLPVPEQIDDIIEAEAVESTPMLDIKPAGRDTRDGRLAQVFYADGAKLQLLEFRTRHSIGDDPLHEPVARCRR